METQGATTMFGLQAKITMQRMTRGINLELWYPCWQFQTPDLAVVSAAYLAVAATV